MRETTLIDRLVRGYFQLWSSTYDLSPLQLWIYRPVHRAVLQAVARPSVPLGRALDLACGTARLTFDLASRYPGAMAVGLDVSQGMLAAARRRLRERTPPLVRGDAYALPFADGSFELVTSTIAYHWLLDAEAALREIRRVLRPGGRLVLGTLVARLLPGTYLGMRLASIRRHREDLAAAGFREVSVRNVGWRTAVFSAEVPGESASH